MRWWLPHLLFLLASCQGNVWRYGSIRSSKPQYNFAKLTYPASHIHDGIELEIVCIGKKEIYAYINVKRYQLTPHEGNVLHTLLTIQTNHSAQHFLIPLLEGGQRARLTEECIDYLLHSIETHASVTLRSDYFSEILNAENFKKYYRNLVDPPQRFFPEHLITFELY